MSGWGVVVAIVAGWGILAAAVAVTIARAVGRANHEEALTRPTGPDGPTRTP